MTRGVRLAIALASIPAVACAPDRSGGERTPTLTVVQRYGTDDIGPDSLQMAAHVRRAGGGVIGSFRGVVQASDSTVFVLDRSWHKIIAFGPDGGLKNVILGGAGEGPGEFKLPVHLGLMPNGDLIVLDYELHRLSFFDQAGSFASLAHVNLAGPMRLHVAGEMIWVTSIVSPGSAAPRAVAVDRQGTVIQAAPATSEVERPFGSPVNLAVTFDGDLLLPHERPGLWDVMEGGKLELRGEELFPGLPPPVVRTEGNVTYFGTGEAWTAGVAALADGRVLFCYATAVLDDAGFPIHSIMYALDLFDSEGRRLGPVALPPDVVLNTWSFYVSPWTGHLFLASDEPYPSVLELRLTDAPP